MAANKLVGYLIAKKKEYETIYLFFLEAKSFYFKLIKYNASRKTSKNKGKMQYALLRLNHTIEKGMSLKNPRKGFGQEKVLNLLRELTNFYRKYRDNEFLYYPLCTIKNYIHYTKGNGVEIPKIEAEFKKLCAFSETDGDALIRKGGTKNVTKAEILTGFDFEKFVKTRHSIRYFSNEKPAIAAINKALADAQQTPSACNRQSWYSYVFDTEQTHELLAWQEGAKGFDKDVPMAILVTANLNAFLAWEPHQAYVDGGMYAMTLIYALHAQGLGTVPLSTGFKEKKIRRLHKKFSIPENEVPIVIIGIGCLLDNFNVAISERKPIELTTRYR